jgi:hypothetical protein
MQNNYSFGEKLLKPGNPYFGPTNPTINQPTTEELNYNSNRAWGCPGATNNLLEVWQNSATFGGRPIGTAVKALLTKVINWQSS